MVAKVISLLGIGAFYGLVFLLGSVGVGATTNGNPNVDLLTWWAGALVLVTYATALAGVGSLLTVRRDVT
jgi:arginine exporter protein ArgO